MKKFLDTEINPGDGIAIFSLVLFIFSFIILAFTGCMTEQKAVGYLQKRGQLPRICADLYPLKINPGTPVTKSDTFYLPGVKIECPPARIDTATGKPEKVFVDCPPSRFVHDTTTVHDTIENTARIAALQLQRDSLLLELRVSQTDEKKARKQANTRLFILLGLGGSAIAFTALKFKNII